MDLKEIELAVLAGASACLCILTLIYEQPLAAVVFAQLTFSTAIIGTLGRQT
jgi:hypothetical protein